MADSLEVKSEGGGVSLQHSPGKNYDVFGLIDREINSNHCQEGEIHRAIITYYDNSGAMGAKCRDCGNFYWLNQGVILT